MSAHPNPENSDSRRARGGASAFSYLPGERVKVEDCRGLKLIWRLRGGPSASGGGSLPNPIPAGARGVAPRGSGCRRRRGSGLRCRGGVRARLVGDDGFTLLEVLVAFTVMAVLLSVLFRGVVGIRAGSNAFGDRTQIELVARAVLDDALADRSMRNGTYSGTRDGRAWTIVARPIDLSGQLPPPPNDTASTPPPGIPSKPTWTTQRLVVSVATGTRPVRVETIRLVKAGPHR